MWQLLAILVVITSRAGKRPGHFVPFVWQLLAILVVITSTSHLDRRDRDRWVLGCWVIDAAAGVGYHDLGRGDCWQTATEGVRTLNHRILKMCHQAPSPAFRDCAEALTRHRTASNGTDGGSDGPLLKREAGLAVFLGGVSMQIDVEAYLVSGGPWQPAILTTDRAECSYGVPVVVVVGEDSARGPAEIMAIRPMLAGDDLDDAEPILQAAVHTGFLVMGWRAGRSRSKPVRSRSVLDEPPLTPGAEDSAITLPRSEW